MPSLAICQLLDKFVLLSMAQLEGIIYINPNNFMYPIVEAQGEIILTNERLKCVSMYNVILANLFLVGCAGFTIIVRTIDTTAATDAITNAGNIKFISASARFLKYTAMNDDVTAPPNL